MNRFLGGINSLILGIIGVVVGTPLFVHAGVYPQTPSSYVVDLADIIDESDEQQLETTIADIEKNTTAEIAILTVPSLDGEDIAMLGTEVAQKWGIGKEDQDNGILVLIAPTEKQRRIDVGYGLEGDIPDITALRMAQATMVPGFQQGDFGGGILALVDAFSGVLYGVVDPTQYDTEALEESGLFLLFLFGAFFALVIGSMMRHLLKTPQKIAGSVLGSGGTALVGSTVFGAAAWGLFLPLLVIRLLVLLVQRGALPTGNRGGRGGFGSGGRGGGSFGGGGFGGFGGGSFGGGGASGSR